MDLLLVQARLFVIPALGARIQELPVFDLDPRLREDCKSKVCYKDSEAEG